MITRRLLSMLMLGACTGFAAAQTVSFRDDHTILVEGAPFFPIGLYYCYEEFEDPSGALLKQLKQFGFNTAGYYRWGEPTWREELQRADAAGIKVWIRGINGLAVDSEQTASAIATQVEQTRTSRALLFWEFQDEPLLNKVPIDQSLKGQELVRRIDRNHPLLTVEWPGAVLRFSEWNSLSDIYATDLYPIPRERGYGRLDNHDITQMRDYLATIRTARGDRPMALVLQAWNWEPLNYGTHGYPTPVESRFMAYQSVIHGAKALLYYGQLHCTRPNSASALYSESKDAAQRDAEFKKCVELNRGFWDQHRGFFKELSEASRIFVLRDKKSDAIRPIEDQPQIEFVGKESGTHQYVLAVNASNKPTRGRFRLPSNSSIQRVHVIFENRSLQVSDGELADDFEPYDVHVYGTTGELP